MPRLAERNGSEIRMVRAYSSVVEHYVDIVGVASSILATPTIRDTFYQIRNLR